MVSEIFTKRKLLKKLKNAASVCLECGDRYGKHSPWPVTCWESGCDVCGKLSIVSDTRDSGYLMKGINSLKEEIMALQISAKLAKREP